MKKDGTEEILPASITMHFESVGDEYGIWLNAMGREVSQLSATVYPDNAADKTVTWASSNPEWVTVDATGLVTFIAEPPLDIWGNPATITARTVNGLKANAAVYYKMT